MDKSRVFFYKTLGLIIRALPILYFYSNKDFLALGNYSLFSSISVVISGIIGFEFHMITSRELANKNVISQKSPLSQHISVIILLAIVINIVLYLLDIHLVAAGLNLVIIFYCLGEHVRFLNFTSKIVSSSKMNLIRDILFCFPFLFLNNHRLFLYATWLVFIIVLLISRRFISFRELSLKIWAHEFVFYITRSHVFLINIISRNLLAYSDRFFVFLSAGTEILGKYAIVAYINSSLMTILNGSVVYVRIPELLSNKISKGVFLKQILLRIIPMIILVWAVLYLVVTTIPLNDIEMSKGIVLAFVLLGICSIFLSTTGQIIYSSEKDRLFVITNVIFTLMVLIISVTAFNTICYLLMVALGAFTIGLWRLAYEDHIFGTTHD